MYFMLFIAFVVFRNPFRIYHIRKLCGRDSFVDVSLDHLLSEIGLTK